MDKCDCKLRSFKTIKSFKNVEESSTMELKLDVLYCHKCHKFDTKLDWNERIYDISHLHQDGFRHYIKASAKEGLTEDDMKASFYKAMNDIVAQMGNHIGHMWEVQKQYETPKELELNDLEKIYWEYGNQNSIGLYKGIRIRACDFYLEPIEDISFNPDHVSRFSLKHKIASLIHGINGAKIEPILGDRWEKVNDQVAIVHRPFRGRFFLAVDGKGIPLLEVKCY